jgi:hypothetical protein
MKNNRNGKHQRQPQRQRNGEMAADRLDSRKDPRVGARLALKERSA